jgi:hypothetical protein
MLGPNGFDPFNDLRLVDLIDEKVMELFDAK